MSETFDMVALETVTNQYLGGDTSLACAPDTAKLIDEEVIKIVREQHQKALQILKENEESCIRLQSIYWRRRRLPERNLWISSAGG